MAYEKTKWENEKTPLCAENLNHMEDGIQGASNLADALEVRMKSAEDRLATCEGDPDVPVARLTAVEKSVAILQEQKAPAGFGYGDIPKYYGIKTGESVNDFIDNLTAAWPNYTTKQICIYDANFHGTSILLTISKYDKNATILHGQTYDGFNVSKRKLSASWTDWMWENPPLTAGVEYCTYEKWTGRPVYTKLIDCGNSENGKTVTFTGIDRVIRYNGYVDRFALPHMWGTSETDPYFANICVTNTEATFFIGASLLGRKTYLQIWYVK